MPLNTNIGGQTRSNKHKENNYVTEDQARHVYKKVEVGNIITMKQEVD